MQCGRTISEESRQEDAKLTEKLGDKKKATLEVNVSKQLQRLLTIVYVVVAVINFRTYLGASLAQPARLRQTTSVRRLFEGGVYSRAAFNRINTVLEAEWRETLCIIID